MDYGTRLGRRAFVGAAATALAGCTGVGGISRQSRPEPVSLEIKTTPADDDPYAIRIARSLSENLNAVGIRTDVVPMATDQLLESVLVDHDFEVYVTRHPGGTDPDFLRSLVHPEHREDRGWRNPFGIDDSKIGSLLDRQRQQSGEERENTVRDLLNALADRMPMTVLAHPDVLHAVRTDRIEDWPPSGIRSASDLLAIEPVPGESLETLQIAVLDDRMTRNRNPLSVEFRDQGLLTGLLYEPLGGLSPTGLEGRLAHGWTWVKDGADDRLRIKLEDARWHDGEPVTAEDVAFTLRFLADTALGTADEPIPAPRFRGRSELVTDVVVIDERTLSLGLDASREVARRVLTLPILPRHEWEPRANPASVAGLDVFGATTEALRWDNPEPVGSGPFQFEEATVGESVRLTRNPDHFLTEPAFEAVTFRVAPSAPAAVELVNADEVEATAPIDASLASEIARSEEATMIADIARSFYHIGYNARRPPLDDASFRRAVSALVDRRTVEKDVFDGFASATSTPLRGEYMADGVQPVRSSAETFPDDPGDLDVAAAIETFHDAGYRVDEDGRLVSGK